jgi:D-alanyl-D-alanine carboxypeptidase (penicillin-binding protein 5/6)
MKKIAALMVLSILLALLTGPVNALASINISSPRAVLMDAKTGQVLYGKNAHQVSYPASITKVMTAALALERGTLTDYVPISRRASYIDGSKIYLLEGEKVTLEQMLYGLMLESGNDAAIAIAEYIGGSVEEFAVMMNDKAAQLGALNTNFTNPNGLPDPNHVTTAYDMALIAKHAMSIPEFRKIVSTVRYIIPETNMQDTRYLYNGNRLIKNTSHSYEGGNGIKTGYTTAARHCFIGSAQRDGKEFITVILNEQNSNTLWDNTVALLEYAFDSFEQLPVVEEGKVIDTIEFMGSNSDVRIVTEQGFHYNIPVDTQKPDINENIVLDSVKPTVQPGERVGHIDYSIGEDIVGKVRLIADSAPGSDVMASAIFSGKSGSSKFRLWWFLFALPVSVLAFRFIIKSRRRKGSMYGRRKNIFKRR